MNIKKHYNKLKNKTWCYGNDSNIFVITDDTGDPCIQIIFTSTYIINTEIAILISYGPELVTLIRNNMFKESSLLPSYEDKVPNCVQN